MDDLVRFAEGGVGDLIPAPPELLAGAMPMVPDPTTKKVRRRPNKGRTKRTDRSPLDEPPWHLLTALGVPLPPQISCIYPTPENWRRGPRYLQWKTRVFRMWGNTCHLCGHGEAYSADHLIPVSVWSNQPYDPMLARPAHGVIQPDGTEGCPTCKVKCNSSRGNKALANQIRDYKPPLTL